MTEKIITAVDLGSSKICVVIAALHDNNKYELKGYGISESKGIENGLVRDLQRTAESIIQAVIQAEEQAGIAAENVFVGVSGQHIRTKNTEGRVSVAVGNQPGEIDQSNIEAVINDAINTLKRDGSSERMEILHCIPQIYDIDSQKGIINPIGMSGFSITVHTHIILAETTHIKNIKRAFEMANISKISVVLGAIATAEAITNDDEKRLGCIVLDIGEGTSDLMIFQNSYLKSFLSIPKGGSLITHDLAIGLRTPPMAAENLKIDFGNALPNTISADAMVEIQGIGGRSNQKKPHSLISEIIQIRLNEILDSCYRDLLTEFNRLDSLTAGLILTGGTSLIKNIQYLIEDENGFNLPCRIAYPETRKLSGAISRFEDPRYSTVIGILYYAMDKKGTSTNKSRKPKDNKITKNISNFFKKTFSKISEL